MSIKVGQIYRIFYNDGNVNNRRVHIRGIVDGQVVERTWSQRRQEWRYGFIPLSFFEDQVKHGVYTRVGTDRNVGRNLEGGKR